MILAPHYILASPTWYIVAAASATTEVVLTMHSGNKTSWGDWEASFLVNTNILASTKFITFHWIYLERGKHNELSKWQHPYIMHLRNMYCTGGTGCGIDWFSCTLSSHSVYVPSELCPTGENSQFPICTGWVLCDGENFPVDPWH